jgi:hypothetical protein
VPCCSAFVAAMLSQCLSVRCWWHCWVSVLYSNNRCFGRRHGVGCCRGGRDVSLQAITKSAFPQSILFAYAFTCLPASRSVPAPGAVARPGWDVYNAYRELQVRVCCSRPVFVSLHHRVTCVLASVSLHHCRAVYPWCCVVRLTSSLR